jgi:hypothetical protein
MQVPTPQGTQSDPTEPETQGVVRTKSLPFHSSAATTAVGLMVRPECCSLATTRTRQIIVAGRSLGSPPGFNTLLRDVRIASVVGPSRRCGGRTETTMTSRGDERVTRPQLQGLPGVSWVRSHTLVTALLSGLVLVVAVVVVLTATGGQTPPSVSHPAPRPDTTAATRGAKWLDGPVGKELNAVNADLVRLATATAASKYGAAKIAGAQLAKDAHTARNSQMPPVDAASYKSALSDLERAGRDAARGDFNTAAPLLNAGTVIITKVTAAVNAPGPASTPSARSAPNKR